jgi:hypothetical protein
MVSAVLVCAQTPPKVRAQLPEPAVPPDPLELITGDAQPVQNADQRAAVMNALTKSVSLSNVRAFPYYRKTTFTSFGSTASDGNWQLEDMSPGGGLYRWTAQGPSYSAINLYTNQMLYSNQPGVAIPVRLAQVRTAMFFVRPFVGPRATLRTASANLNGTTLECVLLSHMGAAQGATGSRRWEEEEYCLDAASGAMITYSPAPGLYIQYDYSQAVHFQDRLIPNKFTIFQAGRTIIEAQTVSVSDPPTDSSLFQQSGLSQLGMGSLMTPPLSVRSVIPSEVLPPGSAQIVAVHGMRSSSGQITDIELLASSNSALNATAATFASNWHPTGAPDDVEPGATPQSREVLMILTFFGATSATVSQR